MQREGERVMCERFARLTEGKILTIKIWFGWLVKVTRHLG